MTPREKRMLAGAAALVVVASTGRGALEWWRFTGIVHHRLEALQPMLAAARATVGVSPVRPSTARQAWPSADSLLLPVKSESAGSIWLAELLANSAEQAGMRIISAIPEADTVRIGVLKRLSMRVQLSGSLANTRILLDTLARHHCALLLNELTLRRSDQGAQDVDLLSVELRLHGWYSAEET